MKLDMVIVTETFPPEVNGVAMTVGHLVGGMRARGHRVSVVRPRQHTDDRGSERERVVSGLPLPGYPGLRLGLPAGRRLHREWQQTRPDVVHVVTEGPLGWSAVSAARRLGIPVTSGFHTNFDRYSVHYGIGWMRPAVSAYLRALHRRAQATLVPTEALAAELAGAGVGGVRVVGRGVDTTLFDPAKRETALRDAWGIKGDGLACLYVGRMAPEKNLTLVHRSFSAIRALHPRAQMIWVGDGPSRRQLEAEHSAHVFAGVKTGEALATHYASADLFLFPSLSETYGNVVAEAMASGVPVLAYRSAAAAELIVDGDNGITVAPGNEAAYLSAAVALCADRACLRAIAGEARRSVLPRSWDAVVARFESVLKETVLSNIAYTSPIAINL